jgi:hypothetical protein
MSCCNRSKNPKNHKNPVVEWSVAKTVASIEIPTTTKLKVDTIPAEIAEIEQDPPE